jgi:hypothetical protein
MVDLRLFFTDNRPLIYFVYGQVFFVMGVATLLQSRRYSRLDLAHSLPRARSLNRQPSAPP